MHFEEVFLNTMYFILWLKLFLKQLAELIYLKN